MDSNIAFYVYLFIIISLILGLLALFTNSYFQSQRLPTNTDIGAIQLQSSPLDGLELLFYAALFLGLFTYGFVQIRKIGGITV